MKRILLYIAILLLLVSGATLVSYRIGHRIGYWKGRSSGWGEAECLTARHAVIQKAEALRLIRSGQTDAGLQFLDHTLDVDILVAGGRSPHCCASDVDLSPSELQTLEPVATYRANYPRLPYTNNYTQELMDAADQFMKDLLENSPNKSLKATGVPAP